MQTRRRRRRGYVYLRQPVYYRTNHPVGTIVVDKSQSFLYVVRPSLSALRYGIGVGPECTDAAGLYQIVRKEEWPGLKVAAGGRSADEERNKNPLGARALYLSKEYRIHGTNTPSLDRPAGVAGLLPAHQRRRDPSLRPLAAGNARGGPQLERRQSYAT